MAEVSLNLAPDSDWSIFQTIFKDTQAKLEQNAEVTNFLRDCTEGVDWIKEKKMDLGGHDHHDEWQKASALSQELAANQSRLDKIRNDGKYVIIYIYLFLCYRSRTTVIVPRRPHCTTVYSLIQYHSTNVN